MNYLNWNDLQYFLSLVKTQTLSASAEQLGVQHTTVSRHIEQLENGLNVKLFERAGNRYVLTIEGELLHAQAYEIEKSIDTFRRMAVEQNALQGTVTLSAPPVLANEWIAPQLSRLRQIYPDICLSLQGEMHYSNLYQREADMAIRVGRPTQNSLVIRKLAQLSYYFYAHKNHQVQDELHLITFQSNQRLSAYLQQIQSPFKTTVTFDGNDLYTIKNAICQGLGIGLLPSFMVKPTDQLTVIELANGRVEQKATTQAVKTKKTEELYLVMHADIRRSAKIRAVADWITEIF
ncbi:MAG: LysR family transcriptional regulator [Gammaproteobacteria bacterium]|nr:MAG: LysR family transcriptional regulator [Gammaproteobacteria bacterium]